MPVNLTKSDVQFTEYRVWQQTDDAGVSHVMASVSYIVTTTQGETINRGLTVELTGAAKTRAAALLQDIKTLAKAQEGIP